MSRAEPGMVLHALKAVDRFDTTGELASDLETQNSAGLLAGPGDEARVWLARHAAC